MRVVFRLVVLFTVHHESFVRWVESITFYTASEYASDEHEQRTIKRADVDWSPGK